MVENSPNPNAAAGQQLQDRYEFYALALAFTTLAAASQTAHFGDSLAADALELAGWVVLLVSGLAAMIRLERKPNVYHLASMLNRYENLRDESQKAILTGSREIFVASEGKSQSMESYLANAKESVRTVNEEFEKHRGRSVALYRVHSYTLFGGITLLVVARALPAFLSIIERLRN